MAAVIHSVTSTPSSPPPPPLDLQRRITCRNVMTAESIAAILLSILRLSIVIRSTLFAAAAILERSVDAGRYLLPRDSQSLSLSPMNSRSNLLIIIWTHLRCQAYGDQILARVGERVGHTWRHESLGVWSSPTHLLCLRWRHKRFVVTKTGICARFFSLKTSVIQLKLYK